MTEQILMFFSIDQDLKNDHWIDYKASKPFLFANEGEKKEEMCWSEWQKKPFKTQNYQES